MGRLEFGASLKKDDGPQIFDKNDHVTYAKKRIVKADLIRIYLIHTSFHQMKQSRNGEE
jgi:hypothetical protein